MHRFLSVCYWTKIDLSKVDYSCLWKIKPPVFLESFIIQHRNYGNMPYSSLHLQRNLPGNPVHSLLSPPHATLIAWSPCMSLWHATIYIWSGGRLNMDSLYSCTIMYFCSSWQQLHLIHGRAICLPQCNPIKVTFTETRLDSAECSFIQYP